MVSIIGLVLGVCKAKVQNSAVVIESLRKQFEGEYLGATSVDSFYLSVVAYSIIIDLYSYLHKSILLYIMP